MTPQRGARIRVTTLATLTHTPWAECNGCDWERGDLGATGWRAIRAAARRHAAHHGHTVSAGYAVIYDYGITKAQP